jgi:hypothetical protein
MLTSHPERLAVCKSIVESMLNAENSDGGDIDKVC